MELLKNVNSKDADGLTYPPFINTYMNIKA